MEAKQMFKQMFDLNKASFDSAFSAMVKLQDQAETATNTLFDQNLRMPKEVKQTAGEWAKVSKKGRDDFKKMMDAGYQTFENLFAA